MRELFIVPSNQARGNHGCSTNKGNARHCSRQVFRMTDNKNSQMGFGEDGTENGASKNDNQNDTFNLDTLSRRIEQLQQQEEQTVDILTAGLSSRVQELQSSAILEEQIRKSKRISLPVVCFDALLPNQVLEGTTEDETFSRLLRSQGLGGWFAMTSLDFKTRKIRRNGVLCKIEWMDIATKPWEQSTITGNKVQEQRIPTSVKFRLVGKYRCRILGSPMKMSQRIGRWRLGYDPDGEESVLGWGEETFLDIPMQHQQREEFQTNADGMESSTKTESNLGNNTTTSSNDAKGLCSTEWTSTEVECFIDSDNALDGQQKKFNDKEIHQYGETIQNVIIPLVDEWYSLASNPKTYDSINVTAGTRIQRGQPGLSVDPTALLNKVRRDIGERPNPTTSFTQFVFWAAALINPLPALGVSLEIRGRMLETYTIDDRLQILQEGLERSIENLQGRRPL